METKDFALKVKSLDDATGHFTAFAARYGELDLQGDVLERGSFAKSIREQGEGYPLLWAHQQETPVGVVTFEDSALGPIAHGKIDREDPDGAVAYRRVKKGIVKGVSIGFTIQNQASVKYRGEVRHLSEIRLHELSLVAVPAQPGAQITSVKSLGDAARLLKSLPVDSLTESQFSDVRALNAEVKRLLAADREEQEKAAVLDMLKRFAKGMDPDARYWERWGYERS